MERTLGIDVSFWQDDNNTPRQIDWKKSKTAGAVFAFIKAGQAAFTDSDFDFNWKESKNAGVLRGAYHFYDYRISPNTQVAHFIKLLKNEPGELPPVMDLEAHPNWPLPPRENLLAVIKTFLETLQTEFGRKPLFYTNPSKLGLIAAIAAGILCGTLSERRLER